MPKLGAVILPKEPDKEPDWDGEPRVAILLMTAAAGIAIWARTERLAQAGRPLGDALDAAAKEVIILMAAVTVASWVFFLAMILVQHAVARWRGRRQAR